MSKDTEGSCSQSDSDPCILEQFGTMASGKASARIARAKKAAPLVFIVGLVLVVVIFVAIHCQVPKIYISLTINKSGIAYCQQQHGERNIAQLPCLTESGLMMTSDKPLAPLSSCADEGIDCDQSWFQMTPERNGVIIPETGVYRVHSRVTFLDGDSSSYLTSTVRVDSGGGGGGAGSDGHRGIWLDCASHSAHAGAGDPFGVCALDGIRRMRRGDIVSFQVRCLGRLINPHGPSTGFFVYKL